MTESCGIMGRTEKVYQHPSAPSNELDWSSPVPDKDSTTRRIPLTQGQFAIVDAEDFDRVSSFKWRVQENKKGGTFYATRRLGNSSIQMHRFIMGITDPSIFLDHRDGNGLNNTKDNLRRATNAQNQWNRRLGKANKSGYRGVYWSRADEKWYAVISVNRKRIYLGSFSDKLDAAKSYAEAAQAHHGEFAARAVLALLKGEKP